MRLNLQNRFLIPTLCLIVLGTGALTILSYQKSSSAIKKATEGQLVLLLEATCRSLDSTMETFKLLVSDWKEEELFRKASQATPDDPVIKPARERLERLNKDYPYFERINVLNKDGLATVSSDPRVAGKANFGDRDYFKAAMKGNFTISEVIPSRTTGKRWP